MKTGWSCPSLLLNSNRLNLEFVRFLNRMNKDYIFTFGV